MCRNGEERPKKEVVAEIQAIIRQITASVTFLPLLQDRCTLFVPTPIATIFETRHTKSHGCSRRTSGRLASC